MKVVLQSTCGVLIANPATNPNTPNTPITYTCSAAGYTGLPANLEYDIVCGGGSLGWSGSSSRICALPGTSSTAFTTTCRIQDKTLSGTIFTGSAVGACVSTLTTTGGGG